MQRTVKSFKSTANQALRQTLRQSVQISEKPFTVRARTLGTRAGGDPGRLNQLADELEVEAFLEATRRLQNADHSPS